MGDSKLKQYHKARLIQKDLCRVADGQEVGLYTLTMCVKLWPELRDHLPKRDRLMYPEACEGYRIAKTLIDR